MRRTVLAVAAATSLALAALAAPAMRAAVAPEAGTPAASSAFEKEAMDVRIKGKAGKPGSTTGITYHNGPVMLGTTNMYFIYYGDWTAQNPSAPAILNDWGNSIGGSPYFNINTTYYNSAGTHVSNAVALAGTTTDSYSQGTTLSDAGVQAVVSNAIAKGLTKDSSALYFVLTSADVSESSGFVTKYCGWHTHGSIGGTDIKYSFVGDATQLGLSSCAQYTSNTPNGNPGADAMVSVMAHELEEAVTDPDLNAWYDRQGAENADKCAWTFGTTYRTSSNAVANMKLGLHDYLIQQNWKAAGSQGCALSY